MQAKGLWGIAVRNNRSKSLANLPEDVERLRKVGNLLRGVIREVDPKALRMAWQGTTSLIDMMNASHILPINNYQYNQSEETVKISGDVFEKEYFEQGVPDGCFPGCNLACTKGCDAHDLGTGPLAGRKVAVDGPEYETAAAVTNLGIFDPDYIMDYAWYCDEYGVDTISAGVTMSFLFEAYEQGFLTEEDTDGLSLRWGETGRCVGTVPRHVRRQRVRQGGRSGDSIPQGLDRRPGSQTNRQGQGRDLRGALKVRDGVQGAGVLHVRHQGVPGPAGRLRLCPEGAPARRGVAHCPGPDQNEMPTFAQKARALNWFPLFRTWFNLVGLCKLPWIDVRHPEAQFTEIPARNMPTAEYYVELVNATLGVERTIEDLLFESEVAYALHKLINLRQGFGTREEDAIPLRAMAPVYMNEFLSRKEYYEKYLAESASMEIQDKSDEEKLEMLQTYRRLQYQKLCDSVYEAKGWDREGIPRKSTLMRLGFHDPKYLSIVDEARERASKQAELKNAGSKLANYRLILALSCVFISRNGPTRRKASLVVHGGGCR